MEITKDQIEALLWEEESTTLDFKQRQYRFAQATDEEKSELLKDILAFTNAFRRSDAFILIGVREVKGGRSEVLGVEAQLDDASLQQFVNSKTQRPVTFAYKAMQIEGLPVAVIHIPLQYRPVYLKRGFGKLKKDVVYLRRGSSTAVAAPDEVARMGADRHVAAAPEPSLSLSLFDRGTQKTLERQVSLRTTLLHVPPESDIPDYSERPMVAQLININSAYYRELAAFTQTLHLMRPLSFAIENAGAVSAHDVRLIFSVEDPDDEYVFMEVADIPGPPDSQHGIYSFAQNLPALGGEDVTVEHIAGTWRVECNFGKIQPQETARLSEDLYVGARRSGTLEINAQIFADNLSQPRPARFSLQFDVDEREVSLDEIKEMERERFFSTSEGRKVLAEMREDSDYGETEEA